MTWWNRVLRRRKLERQLDVELRDHLDRQIADYMRRGLTEADARRRAHADFGGVEQTKESCRDARGTRWLDEIAQDLRHGLRVLWNSPAFTLVAVLSLALGIGANSAIFSLVNSLVLKALPVHEPERLTLIDGEWTNPIWEQIRDRRSQVFENAAAFSDARFDLARGGEKQLVQGLWVSGDFFTTLGIPAILGRALNTDDDQRGGHADGPTAVISYAYWQRQYGGSADAIGRAISLDGVSYTIVGVTAPGFYGPLLGRSFDVAVPIGTQVLAQGQEKSLDARSYWWLTVYARLKPGQSLEAATTALRGVQPQIREATIPPEFPAEAQENYLREGLNLVPAAYGAPGARERFQRPLFLLMGVVAFVLLIACANIANLLLARASGRRHELSVRLALGASRFRLARQLLTESLLLAAMGAALGLVFARVGVRLLMTQFASGRDPIFLDLSVDWRVLAFTGAVAIATALLFGIAPAFRAGRVEPTEALKEQGRSLTGERRQALSQPLVVLQVALSLTLVVVAGLFVRTFASLAARDVGFDRDPLLIVSLDPKRSQIDPAQRVALYTRATDAVAAVPGVARAGVSMLTPASGAGWNAGFEFPHLPNLSRRDRAIFLNAISPGWFATYGTTMIAGRDFSADDRRGAPQVAIVNEAFSRKYLNGDSPIDYTLRQAGFGTVPAVQYRIVGMVKNAIYRASLRTEMPPLVYIPIAQMADDDQPPFASITVRAATGSPVLLTKSVAAAIGQVDPNLSLTFRPLADQVNATMMGERMLATLSGFFGALALLLAGIGLYGVTSYAVNRRRTEIGIRIALGADARGVLHLILRRVAFLVGLGILIGGAFSLWAARFMGTMLYGLQPRDPATFIAAAGILIAVGALAGWLPARRAARIDAAQVLREG